MKPRPLVTLVAAVSSDGYISTGLGVPWNLPRDKRHFRSMTAGQWLLIGRRTYEEMLGWFRDHHPLVLTRDSSYHPPVGGAVPDIATALEKSAAGDGKDLFVLGGGPVFATAMAWADRLVITHVADVLGGGVPFPAIDPEIWQAISVEDHPADSENILSMSFVTYERRNKHPGKPV